MGNNCVLCIWEQNLVFDGRSVSDEVERILCQVLYIIRHICRCAASTECQAIVVQNVTTAEVADADLDPGAM